MKQNEIKFTLVDTKKVCVSGFPELEGREGCYLGEGMAMFWGKEWRNYELFVANTTLAKSGNCQRKEEPCWWTTGRLTWT